jgi:hypothetical protein
MSDKKAKPTCYVCHQDIIFDKNILSPNNIQIPLDPETKKPHECPKPEPEQTESVKAEYVDHTLVIGKPSEVKIFFSQYSFEVEKEYREFQIGKKFVWSRAQYQPVRDEDNKVLFTIAFYYEVAK